MEREGERDCLIDGKVKKKRKKITTTAILISLTCFLSCFFILPLFCVLLYSSETGRVGGKGATGGRNEKSGGFCKLLSLRYICTYLRIHEECTCTIHKKYILSPHRRLSVW